MSASAGAAGVVQSPQARAEAAIRRKRWIAIAVPALIALYLGYVALAFDAPGVLAGANGENARTLVRDSYSHKVHVTRDNRSGEVEVAIEGERKGLYPEGETPDWVALGETAAGATAAGGTTVIDLGDGHVVRFTPEAVTYDVPGYGLIEASPDRRGVNARFPGGPLPEWINASANRVAITTEAGRLSITRNRTEVFRYFLGWELFFFTLDSPYHDMGWGEIASRALSGEAGAIAQDFWTNEMWRHRDVAWAILETILMAFLGTFGAAIIALPLAFLAARGFAPLLALRFAVRRGLDFLRGVDGLIWTIVLSRAFGPGPLTGALAILLTDTGTFGKMFSEALENVDGRQIEGVRSTGAGPMARIRYGVLPQLTPVWMSQALFSFESSVRSATIIGAITGGGIGLLLTQAMITQKDWEEVSYYIVLIVLMVSVMDTISGRLRRRVITGGGGR